MAGETLPDSFIRTWMVTQSDDVLDELVSELITGATGWLAVVKSLGDYLTSVEEERRKKGVEFLSALLQKCPVDKHTPQSTHVMITFLCSKLEDYTTQVPALKGLLALVSSPICSSEDAVNTVKSLFQQLQMKSLVQGERLLAWSIVDCAMSNHREAMKELGSDFVGSYATFADGEKDPRNLVISFALSRVILIEFDAKPWVESLFNITFCYFPIAYRPPPNDPYNISTDMLRTALRGCLAAFPDFGPLAIPLFLEKLLAGSPASKRDTLETMSACFPVYGPALARSWAKKLWNSLKLEIFQPTDSLTESLALSAMLVLIKTIYADQGETMLDDELQGLAKYACDECLDILKEPEKSQARPATKILCSFISEGSSLAVARYTISQVLSHLLKIFVDPQEAPTRGSTLLLLSDILAAVKIAQTKTADLPPELLLESYKDELLGALMSGLNAPSTRTPALGSLRELLTLPHSTLTREELGFVIHNANELVQLPDDDDYRDDLLSLLADLSTQSTTAATHIEAQVLPPLFSRLPDAPPSRTSSVERAEVWKTLDALEKLCLAPPLFEVLVIRLVAKLDVLFSEALRKLPDDAEPVAAYCHAILKTLAKSLHQKAAKPSCCADISKYIDGLLPRLLRIFIYAAMVDLANSDTHFPFCDPRLLSIAGEICGAVVKAVPYSRQQSFITSIFGAYLHGKIESVIEGERIEVNQTFAPFSDGATPRQRNTVAIFASCVVPLSRQVVVPVSNLSDYLLSQLDWVLGNADSSTQRLAVLGAMASIVNKKAEDLGVFLDYISNPFASKWLSNTGLPLARRLSAVEAYGWIIKALAVRSHPLSMPLTENLFSLLDDPSAEEEIRMTAARSFGFIASPSSHGKLHGSLVFTKANNSVVKVLFSQRFVQSTLPRMMQNARPASAPVSSPTSVQVCYLLALTSLVTSVPNTVYLHALEQLMPLLLLSLDLPDPDIKVNVINTLIAALEVGIANDSGRESKENEPDHAIKKIVAEQASKLVSSMVNNIRPSPENTTAVRLASLSLLNKLPKVVEYSILHPIKASVIKQIGAALDDPKRLVRKEAVDARTTWFRLGANNT